jgi:hypothetical protein
MFDSPFEYGTVGRDDIPPDPTRRECAWGHAAPVEGMP